MIIKGIRLGDVTYAKSVCQARVKYAMYVAYVMYVAYARYVAYAILHGKCCA